MHIRSAARKQRSSRSGFTLVEVAMSAGILLVVSMAGYGAQIRSAGLIDASQGRMVAIADLEACIEEVTSLSTVQIPDSFPPGESIEAYENQHLLNMRVTPTYPGYVPGNPIPDPIEIVLTATWTSGSGHNQTLRLATAKAQ